MYERFFNVLTGLTVAGLMFICCSVPYLFSGTEEQPVTEPKPLMIDLPYPEVEAPDASEAFELKANRERAKAVIAELASIMAKVDEVEPQLAPQLVYLGTFYVTMYSNTPAQCGNSLGITYSGKKVTEDPTCRTIAVDPSVIPLGSKLIVEGYPNIVWEAADTGSAIKGYDLDLFTSSESESLTFNPVYLDAWLIVED